ncbi:hypothetical protein CGCSCA1_v011317 [Colletotrichum siamense]|nr:hypothetical protein CGCSCA1_v011317 [Colletotrichum siamense]
MTKDWDPLRDEIKQLYHVENRKLTEVMRIIHGRHDFKASERSYRAKLRKWGYMKYSTQDFPKPNRRSQPSKRHSGPSSRGKGAVTASDLSFAAHNLDQR